MGAHEAIAGDLKSFGGLLRCTVCGVENTLPSDDSRWARKVGSLLRTGWPKHCGYTMRWVTDSQLAEERRKDASAHDDLPTDMTPDEWISVQQARGQPRSDDA